MEGRVFICSWKKVGDRYRVWWKARPKVAAEGDTFEEADEELWDAIMEATGDGENMHEYDPPSPSDIQASPRAVDIVMVGGQESGKLDSFDGLFVGGVCAECENALGPRTDAQVVIAQMNSGPRNCGSLRRGFGGSHMRYASADFRAMLTPDEDESVEWRDIVGPPRARKKLFEVMGGRATAPYVAAKGVMMSGWRCETCGHTSKPFAGHVSHKGPSWYVAASALPSPVPTMFLLGESPEWRIVFTRERWRELMTAPGAKGCKSYSIGVLADEAIDLSPVTPTLRELNERVK